MTNVNTLILVPILILYLVAYHGLLRGLLRLIGRIMKEREVDDWRAVQYTNRTEIKGAMRD
jgi:hypothetical protein